MSVQLLEVELKLITVNSVVQAQHNNVTIFSRKIHVLSKIMLLFTGKVSSLGPIGHMLEILIKYTSNSL